MNVVYGVVLLAESDDAIAHGIALGSAARTLEGGQKELAPGVLAEVMTEDTETTVAVAEALGGLLGRKFIDEESAQGLVLSGGGISRLEEDLGEVC
jgi:hypothetical protein